MGHRRQHASPRDASLDPAHTRGRCLLPAQTLLLDTIWPVLLPMLFAPAGLQLVAIKAAWALTLSHLVVQIIKRGVLRERPSVRIISSTHVIVPDKFSFPSGHSCAVMSVAFVYAMAYPAFALPMLLLSGLVGWSRVRLGVHYPGDVLAGQAIAIATGLLILGTW